MRLVVQESPFSVKTSFIEQISPALRGLVLLHLLEVGLLLILGRGLSIIFEIRHLVLDHWRLLRRRAVVSVVLPLSADVGDSVDVSHRVHSLRTGGGPALHVPAASDGRARPLGAATDLRLDAVTLGRLVDKLI